ncbi:2-oxoglutarate dehydrogenase complex dihydrolipoyllysine-residue succinyltransferase [Maioricimonas sp. JC845]|uniref:2-oxoglutarate dehydrogenase complex dihydrolipoyllysine-residue succinyltransferase n=1 Tax=Maioricimonas sp. JC845 TaxID=3232138 RepID=UPI00345B1A0A
MAIEIKVPSVGESISEVFIGEWYVSEGGWVDADANIVGLETDKATFDVPAPKAGQVTQILKEAGDTAAIGDVIAHLEPGENPNKQDGDEAPAASAAQSAAAPAAPAAPAPSAPAPGGTRVMPAASRALAEKGLAAEQVAPTGPGGRLLKEDVMRHGAGGDAAPGGAREERRVTMTPIRQTIAKRLVEAQQTAALLTTFNEADMSAIKRLRAQYQDEFVKKYGIKLGFMSFFVRAVVDALNEYPAVGATIEDKQLVYRNYCDIGVAIGGGKGLVVPIIRNAERMSFAEIELAIADFATRAKENRIGLEELEGGTFTISNGGVYGSLMSTPIVNPPQSGVLGMHAIQDRPVVVNGEIVVRPMMYLALTYDHRVVDGREAVSFLRRIKEGVEDPTRLVLEV